MARIVQEGKTWARFKRRVNRMMDDPTSRCENDAGLGARLLELLISIRSSFFLCGTELVPAKRID